MSTSFKAQNLELDFGLCGENCERKLDVQPSARIVRLA